MGKINQQCELDYKILYNLTVSVMGKLKELSEGSSCETLSEVCKRVNYVIDCGEESIERIDVLPNVSCADERISLEEVCSGTIPDYLNCISYEGLYNLSISTLGVISDLTKDAAADPALEIHEISTDTKSAFDSFTEMLSNNSRRNGYRGLASQLQLLIVEPVEAAPAAIREIGI